MNLQEQAIKILKDTKLEERNPIYREAIFNIDGNKINYEDAEFLASLYFKLKDISLRNGLLNSLSRSEFAELKDFFLKAYKRERYLDVRIVAVRGYSVKASEIEVGVLMNNFMSVLKKREQTTPCNYQEYEYLRSKAGLPFLVNRYKYPCFQNVLDQVEAQYERMPSAFKDIYTFEEDGTLVRIKSADEANKIIQDYFDKHSGN